MIIRFENIVGYDVGQGINLYEIRVRYITMNNEEYVYLFDLVHGRFPGQYVLKKIPIERESSKAI